jgi:hypothetical protein
MTGDGWEAATFAVHFISKVGVKSFGEIGSTTSANCHVTRSLSHIRPDKKIGWRLRCQLSINHLPTR